jgi:uncharacterized protein YbgA (DUF1722 family)/uncharacterized protein YbbK (DUF523 family)
MNKPKIGISACLLGQNVRYDGQHKLDHYLHDILGRYVDYVPVCPEVGCGLPVPREAMRLVGDKEAQRLMTVKTGIDHTERMLSWCRMELDALEKEHLSGFIFKSKSPSSGLRDAKVYTTKGFPALKGPGLFAREFTRRFPLVPVEDEARLHDDGLRENFIERIFSFSRWQEFVETDGSIGGLVAFHAQHKLLFMAHSVKHLRELGMIAGNAKGMKKTGWQLSYRTIMVQCLAVTATPKKHANVLMHAMGYFKEQLSADEKQELLELIDQYRIGTIPLIVPVTLVKHYARKYREHYLLKQVYLDYFPLELNLRNHV